jgi:hypothetical protein
VVEERVEITDEEALVAPDRALRSTESASVSTSPGRMLDRDTEAAEADGV